jgi:hypothetical protein
MTASAVGEDKIDFMNPVMFEPTLVNVPMNITTDWRQNQ